MFWLKSCPRCGGDLYQEEDFGREYLACLQCSRRFETIDHAVQARIRMPLASPMLAPLKGRRSVGHVA